MTYLEALEHNLRGLSHVSAGACPTCEHCGPFDPDDCDACDVANEGGFSWSSCDACGSSLGGDRYPAHGFSKPFDNGDDILVHLDVCADCLCYLANGDVPEDWEED